MNRIRVQSMGVKEGVARDVRDMMPANIKHPPSNSQVDLREHAHQQRWS